MKIKVATLRQIVKEELLREMDLNRPIDVTDAATSLRRLFDQIALARGTSRKSLIDDVVMIGQRLIRTARSDESVRMGHEIRKLGRAMSDRVEANDDAGLKILIKKANSLATQLDQMVKSVYTGAGQSAFWGGRG